LQWQYREINIFLLLSTLVTEQNEVKTYSKNLFFIEKIRE